MTERSQFEEFEATELFCSQCGCSNPVRRRLLMILPDGKKYDYRCSVCGASVGSKMDNDSSEFSRILQP